MQEKGLSSTQGAQIPNTDFTHEPLRDPSEQIRLLEVKAQQPGTRLELKLSVHSLADDLHFYAMSYTWGDDKNPEIVTVNGKPLEVTKNCHYALTQVQSYYPSKFSDSSTEYSSESKYIWIDSICINQKDDIEKGHQVGMMGRIYNKASKVLACVGPHADDSEKLAEILNPRWSANLRKSLKQYPVDHEFIYEDDQRIMGPIKNFVDRYVRQFKITENSFGTQFRKSFFAFTNRSYWSRVWIIQEIAATARSECLLEVFCGSDKFSRSELSLLFYIFGYLCDLTNCTSKDEDFSLMARQPRHCFKFVMGEAGSDPEIWAEYVLSTIDQSFKCRQPEDRVYGVLSLMKWFPENGPPIQPVYGPSAAFDLAERMISMQRYLTFEDVQKIMVALEIYHNKPQLEMLVRTRSGTSHENGDLRHNLPYKRCEKGYHCAILSKNSADQLTAFLVSSGDKDFGSPVLDDKVSNVQRSSDQGSEMQLMFLDSEVVGLLCSRAQAGDLVVQTGFGRGLLVLRRTKEGSTHEIVGQGILCARYHFPNAFSFHVGTLESRLRRLQDIHSVRRDLEAKSRRGVSDYRGGRRLTTEQLEKYQATETQRVEAKLQEARQSARGDFYTKLTFNIAPVDLMIMVGQDMERDESQNAEKSLQRLATEIRGVVEIPYEY